MDDLVQSPSSDNEWEVVVEHCDDDSSTESDTSDDEDDCSEDDMVRGVLAQQVRQHSEQKQVNELDPLDQPPQHNANVRQVYGEWDYLLSSETVLDVQDLLVNDNTSATFMTQMSDQIPRILKAVERHSHKKLQDIQYADILRLCFSRVVVAHFTTLMRCDEHEFWRFLDIYALLIVHKCSPTFFFDYMAKLYPAIRIRMSLADFNTLKRRLDVGLSASVSSSANMVSWDFRAAKQQIRNMEKACTDSITRLVCL